MKASYRAWFIDGNPPGLGDNTEEVLARIGMDAEQVVIRANSQEVANKVEQETNAARALGIFGSPTFVVDEEIFWGDDQLEDALDWAQQHA